MRRDLAAAQDRGSISCLRQSIIVATSIVDILYLKKYFSAHVTSKYIEHDRILRAQDKFREHWTPQESVFYGLDIITCISIIKFNTAERNLYMYVLLHVYSDETTLLS